jgi:acetyltransferase
VDLWPAIEKHLGSAVDVYSRALAALLADPEVDAVFLHAYAGGSRFRLDLSEWARLSQSAAKPLFVWLLGHRDHLHAARQEALTLGIPIFSELSRAAECLAALLRKRPRPSAVGTEGPLDGNWPADLRERLRPADGPLDEHLSKEALRALGIPTVPERIVATATEAEAAAAALGYPVVMKGLLPGGIHKTELGLVQLGIADGRTARSTFTCLMGKMQGTGRILVQKQLSSKVELILGLVRDPQFGPCVLFGLGGVTAELYRDTAFAVAPLSQREALETIGRIRGQGLLDGFRGMPAVNREALARLLVRLGEIGLSFPEIREIDINPLLADETGITAVDATLVLERPEAMP